MREELLARCQAVQERLERCSWRGYEPGDAEIALRLGQLLGIEHSLDQDGPEQLMLVATTYEREIEIIEKAERLAEEKGL